MGLDGSDKSSPSPCSSPRSPRLQLLHNLMHAAATAASSSPPPSPSGDPQRLILQHYAARSSIPSSSSPPHPSPIANVKLLHAWITWRQIQIFSRPGDSVLDLACGKGGDLPKWSLALAGSYFGVDAVAPLLDEARRRHSSLGAPFPASFLCADCFAPGLLSSEPSLSSRLASFDICSCQFALHYAWCSEERARAAIRHVSALLRPGGYFIGTIPDAVAILAKLRQALRSPAPAAAAFAGSPPSPHASAAALQINKMHELFAAKLAIETVSDVDGVESGTESIGDDEVDCFCYVIGSDDTIDGFLDYSHSRGVQEIIEKQQQQKIIGRIGVKLMEGMGPGAVDGIVDTYNVDSGLLAAAASGYAPELANMDGYSGSNDDGKGNKTCRCKLGVRKGRSLHGQGAAAARIDGGEDSLMRRSSSRREKQRRNGIAFFGNSQYRVTFSEENWRRALSLQLEDDDSEEDFRRRQGILLDGEGNERVEASPFGIRYEFYLADAVNHCPEWLVPLSSLVRLAEEEGLRLVSTANFHHFYQRHSSHYSHNHKALTAEDWDCAAIYLAFAFQKQEQF